MSAMSGAGAKVIVLPELCLTAYTCEDLFLQQALLERAELRLADVEIGRGDHPNAITRLKAFVEKHPESPLKPLAEELLRLLQSARP